MRMQGGIALLACVCSLIFLRTDVKGQVTGRNVVYVEYSSIPKGFFKLTATGSWQETTIEGNAFYFSELQRDDWSVYMLDKSRNLSVQLDLYKKEIYINWETPQRAKLCNIVSASNLLPGSNQPDDAGPVGYTKCATENQAYTFTNPVDVAYGSGRKFVYKTGVNGAVSFDNITFGDPNPGIPKYGFYKSTSGIHIDPVIVVDPEILYEDIPDIPQSDLDNIMNWIKHEVTGVKLPYCWRQSRDRGFGQVASSCPDGKEMDGALCYTPCANGYGGAAFVCWQRCPSGFRDDGAFCAKPSPRGRGAGYPWKFGDGFNLDNARRRCANANPQGCEQYGEIIYPKCDPGYSAVGCCTCSPVCPPDFGADIGVSCTKKSYNRDPGEVLTCPDGTIRDETGGPLGLCYPRCDEGFHGVGPVCWQNCEPGWTECGAGCARTQMECGTSTLDQTLSVLILAANIATLGLAAPETAALKSAQEVIMIGGKAVTGTSRIGSLFVKALKTIQSINPAGLAKDVSIIRRVYQAKTGTSMAKIMTAFKTVKSFYKAGTDFYSAFADDFAAQTSPEINNRIDQTFTNPATARYIKQYWGNIQLVEMAHATGFQTAQDVLSVVSIVDITGITGVVAAFTKPVCQDHMAFPVLSQQY